jgi:hypothetical protein
VVVEAREWDNAVNDDAMMNSRSLTRGIVTKYFSTIELLLCYRTVLMIVLSVLYCSTLSLWHCLLRSAS